MGLNLNNLILITAINAVVVAVLLTWYAYGFRSALNDHSNSRSLHQGSAITGAGIFMFLPLCLSIILVFPEFVTAYLLLIMTVLGLADDRFDLSFKFRLLIQLLVMTVCLIYYQYEFNFLMLFLLIAGIWWINLFNFMDGANGMAGLHGLVILTFYAIVFSQHQSLNFILTSAIAIILLYLIFNVYLKKLFMGDSGSLPMAFLLVVMAFWSIRSGWLNYIQIAIIHAVFIVDATLTLLGRIKNQENITQAHASHLYQRLIKSGQSHLTVSLVYAMVTVCLSVVAYLVDGLSTAGQVGCLIGSYFILLLIFFKTINLAR
jgi:UDP-N-acetylmuramyl pentapeptide phosphotransferase/UDP-N-acetylglucosamine-1-phosphate transferase